MRMKKRRQAYLNLNIELITTKRSRIILWDGWGYIDPDTINQITISCQ